MLSVCVRVCVSVCVCVCVSSREFIRYVLQPVALSECICVCVSQHKNVFMPKSFALGKKSIGLHTVYVCALECVCVCDSISYAGEVKRSWL